MMYPRYDLQFKTFTALKSQDLVKMEVFVKIWAAIKPQHVAMTAAKTR